MTEWKLTALLASSPEREDRVMSDEQIEDIYAAEESIQTKVTDFMKATAEAQDEITWKAREPEIAEAHKAGIEKVVKWLRQYAIHGGGVSLRVVLFDMEAHSQLMGKL